MRVGEPIRHHLIAQDYRTPRPSWRCVAGWVVAILAMGLIGVTV